MEFLAELWSWLASFDAPFAFLLALPFVVAAVGLGAYAWEQRRRKPKRDTARAAANGRANRAAHVQ